MLFNPKAFLKNKRVLVTGATSFMGAALVRRLVASHAQVSALISPKKRTRRLEDIQKNLSLECGDITDAIFLKKWVQDVRPQVIFHLASYGVHPGQTDIEKLSQINMIGTANLIAALQGTDFRSFINTGSPAEYGFCREKMRETTPLSPSTFYGATKAAGTFLVQAMRETKPERNIVTLRPFYVYGPGEEENTRFISTAIRHCLSGEAMKLTFLEDTRDFIHVEDVVDAYLLAASKKNLRYPVYNIGSSREYRLKDVIAKIEKLLGKKLKFHLGAYQKRPWHSRCWTASIERAKKDLGWSPRRSLDHGIQEMIAWIRLNG